MNETCLICEKDLELEEIDLGIGLCARHFKEYESKNYFAMICFNCCTILNTYHKRSIIKGEVVKDDHLFCEKCPRCSKDTEYSSLSYLTINELPARLALYITNFGELSLYRVNSNSSC